MKKIFTSFSLALTMIMGLLPTTTHAVRYEQDLMLHGAATSTKVSGYRGTPFELSVNDGEHAIYGISSQEKGDKPCWLWFGTESINDSGRRSGATKKLCNGTPKSRVMKAQYRNDMYFGSRVFVTGVRVCTNSKGTRVKGFQLIGKKLGDDGQLAALNYPEPSGDSVVYTRLVGGRMEIDLKWADRSKYVNDAQFPADFRNNCKDWKAWAECPQHNQIATGVIGHFEAGKNTRSLTGIALQCRYVSKPYH